MSNKSKHYKNQNLDNSVGDNSEEYNSEDLDNDPYPLKKDRKKLIPKKTQSCKQIVKNNWNLSTNDDSDKEARLVTC